MIKLKLIQGSEIVVNSDLIEYIEATPDTIISLSTGRKIIVQDTVDDIIDKIVAFRSRIGVRVKNIECEEQSTDEQR